jgi:nucleoside-diphosphate-sugar epimerase
MGILELRYLKEKYKIDASTLVLHNVYGRFCDTSERSQVIPSLIKRVLALNDGDILTVWGSGKQGRAFVHSSDIVTAFETALITSNLPEIIQIGPNKCTSIGETAENIIGVSGKKITIHFEAILVGMQTIVLHSQF